MHLHIKFYCPYKIVYNTITSKCIDKCHEKYKYIYVVFKIRPTICLVYCSNTLVYDIQEVNTDATLRTIRRQHDVNH